MIVGIDFGTSATKVIWQDLSDNHFEVFKWNNSGVVLDSLLLPSTITFRDGLVYFGIPESEVLQGDVWLTSIKLCVLCSRKSSICRCKNVGADAGVIRNQSDGSAWPARALASLFLGNVMREVENRLLTRYASDELVIIWNIGCPMDHLDIEDRRVEWEKMAAVAMALRTHILNPVSRGLVDEAVDLLEGISVAPQEERNFFVQPEGLAAIKAFLESPHAEAKTYAIVDVGAGTTEVSFFFNGHIMTERDLPLRASYLADSTEAVGGRKIDIELADELKCSVEEARRRKECEPLGFPNLPTIGEISMQYRRTCGRVVQSRKLVATSDKLFDLFIIGGGGRLEVLRHQLRTRELPGSFVLQRLRHLSPPRSLKDRESVESDFDFLANACGLASSLDWQYYPPKDISSLDTPLVKPRFEAEELYPK
ncbi:MAG: hypothetical protein QM757_01255 [Paludibaculum sp.]